MDLSNSVVVWFGLGLGLARRAEIAKDAEIAKLRTEAATKEAEIAKLRAKIAIKDADAQIKAGGDAKLRAIAAIKDAEAQIQAGRVAALTIEDGAPSKKKYKVDGGGEAPKCKKCEMIAGGVPYQTHKNFTHGFADRGRKQSGVCAKTWTKPADGWPKPCPRCGAVPVLKGPIWSRHYVGANNNKLTLCGEHVTNG